MSSTPFTMPSEPAHASPIKTHSPESAIAPASGELPRPYACPMCQKAFHRLEHQTRHIRTHTGEKPHACSFPGCTKRFSRSDELTRHARIHSNPNSRRNGRISSQHNCGQPQHLQSIANENSSSNSSPNVSPPDRGATGHSYQNPRHEGEFEDMNALATAASQQLEQERAGSHHGHSTTTTSPYRNATFPSQFSYQSSHYNSGPYNRPILTMSRQHSQDDDDHGHVTEHRSKRSRPGSPVFSTAPNSPLASHKPSPTPEHTPVVTPAHSPRLHPRDLDLLNGIHLPPFRELSLGRGPPKLPALEVDPFQPKSGYSSPQYPRDQPPVNASKLSDILGSTTDNRTLPVPRVSISDLVSLSPGATSMNGSLHGHPSSPRSTPQSRSSSHLNLRDLM